jgi:hypothetical protein
MPGHYRWHHTRSGSISEAQEADVVTYRNMRTGRVVTVDVPASIDLMDAASKWIRVEDEPAVEPVEAAVEEPVEDVAVDGIYHRGGPWFDVTVDGETVKVQGRQNAEDVYEEMGGI